MNHSIRKRRKAVGIGTLLGCSLAVLTGLAAGESRAQQVAAPGSATTTAPAGTRWYGYVPGQGWVSYAPPSGSAVSPAAAVYPSSPGYPAGTAPVPPPGWAGYSPATAWMGYAPASAGIVPAVRPGPITTAVVPPGPARRRAANLFVNRGESQYSYALSSYREYGTGRNIPLAKPWLPPSP